MHGHQGVPILPAHVCTDLGLRVQREGTLESDTTCTCNEGQHCTSNTCESCTPHSPCPPGFGVKQTGKWLVGKSALEETGAEVRDWAVGPRPQRWREWRLQPTSVCLLE